MRNRPRAMTFTHSLLATGSRKAHMRTPLVLCRGLPRKVIKALRRVAKRDLNMVAKDHKWVTKVQCRVITVFNRVTRGHNKGHNRVTLVVNKWDTSDRKGCTTLAWGHCRVIRGRSKVTMGHSSATRVSRSNTVSAPVVKPE